LNAKPDAVFSSLLGGGSDCLCEAGQTPTASSIKRSSFPLALATSTFSNRWVQRCQDGILATFGYAFDMPVKGKEKNNEEFVAKFKQRAGYEPKTAISWLISPRT
jgi:hypothetical protein